MAAKKVGGGKTPPKPSAKKAPVKKVAAKKAPAKKVAAKKPLTAYQRAVMGPAKSAGKGKLQPRDAAWRAEVDRKNKAYNKSFVHRFVEPASSVLGPMAAIKYVAEAVTGRNLDAPAGSKKKTSRLGAVGNAALAATPLKGARTVYKTVKGVKDSTRPKANIKSKVVVSGQPKTSKTSRILLDSYVQKEVNKIMRQQSRKKKK